MCQLFSVIKMPSVYMVCHNENSSFVNIIRFDYNKTFSYFRLANVIDNSYFRKNNVELLAIVCGGKQCPAFRNTPIV